MNTRIMAVALVVVGLVGTQSLQAQGSVTLVRVVPIGTVPEDLDWSTFQPTIIVIGGTAQPFSFPASCGAVGGITAEGIETVTIKPSHPAIFLTEYVLSSPVTLSPGDRISFISTDTIQCALDEAGMQISPSSPDATQVVRKLTGTLQQPASAGLALFTSRVELDADSIGVVTGQPNDDGTQTVIFKKQGSPAQQVDIDSDVGLLPADVLRDLIDLGCDPDTGEHLYLADIEW